MSTAEFVEPSDALPNWLGSNPKVGERHCDPKMRILAITTMNSLRGKFQNFFVRYACTVLRPFVEVFKCTPTQMVLRKEKRNGPNVLSIFDLMCDLTLPGEQTSLFEHYLATHWDILKDFENGESMSLSSIIALVSHLCYTWNRQRLQVFTDQYRGHRQRFRYSEVCVATE